MGDIYTLADNGTNKAGQNQLMVNGEGSDLNNIDALHGRAKRKTITQVMMLNLIKLAQENGEPELEKSYWNTYYCQQKIVSSDGKFYGNYCKNRFCTLCCSIRKAEIMNRYYPIMKDWEEPYFVTLTVKSCKADQLEKYVKSLLGTFQKITEKYRKRHQRGTGSKLIGIKSLECNFNATKQWYNPHFHVIVKEKWMADVLVAEWLKRSKPNYTLKWCQDVKKVSDLENGLIEIIKYGSKIFTEPDLKKRAKETDTAHIFLKALDTILLAMKGKRIFDRFGFNSPKKEKLEVKPPTILTNFDEWEYDIKVANWVNQSTGEMLSNYKLPSHLGAILENNMDLVLF